MPRTLHHRRLRNYLVKRPKAAKPRSIQCEPALSYTAPMAQAILRARQQITWRRCEIAALYQKAAARL